MSLSAYPMQGSRKHVASHPVIRLSTATTYPHRSIDWADKHATLDRYLAQGSYVGVAVAGITQRGNNVDVCIRNISNQ